MRSHNSANVKFKFREHYKANGKDLEKTITSIFGLWYDIGRENTKEKGRVVND